MFVLNTRHLMAARLVSLAAWSTGAYAGTIEQLNAFVSNVSTARGEFVQRRVKGSTDDNPLRATGTSNGDLVFSHPGRFVQRYVRPYEQQLSADGQILCIFDKDLNQIAERKLDASLGSSPAAVLFGSNDLAKNFTLKEGGTKDGINWAKLTPKAKDTQFQRIAIGFRSGELQGMGLHDAFGNTTLLTFSNTQKSPQLPASAFHFMPPKGADVIKRWRMQAGF